MMRQNADGDYLVAAATDESSRALSIPLSFLPRGKWIATVNTDGASADYRTNREATHTQTIEVSNTTTLRVLMAPGGGTCILIKKQ